MSASGNSRGRGGGSYQRQLRGRREDAGRVKRTGRTATTASIQSRADATKFDHEWGYQHIEGGDSQTGYLVNMLPTTVVDDDRVERSGVDLYFMKMDGSTFKATLVHRPYFFVECNSRWTREVASMLERRFEGALASVSVVRKEDLDMPNHLAGLQATFLQLSFRNVGDLMDVRREIRPAVERNRRRANRAEVYEADAVRPSPSVFRRVILAQDTNPSLYVPFSFFRVFVVHGLAGRYCSG